MVFSSMTVTVVLNFFTMWSVDSASARTAASPIDACPEGVGGSAVQMRRHDNASRMLVFERCFACPARVGCFSDAPPVHFLSSSTIYLNHVELKDSQSLLQLFGVDH